MNQPHRHVVLKWTQSLSTGSVEIDDQHKELFRRVNAFLVACQSRQGSEHIAEVFRFLQEYVELHFSMEEAHMRQHNFPEEQMHVLQHRFFAAEITQLKKLLDKDGPTEAILDRANRILVGWLIEHVKIMDKELGDCIRDTAIGL
jgi:hemerythrin